MRKIIFFNVLFLLLSSSVVFADTGSPTPYILNSHSVVRENSLPRQFQQISNSKHIAIDLSRLPIIKPLLEETIKSLNWAISVETSA